ncbi:hypothetical protein [Streptomyces sp. MBT33]|nr:hypothetical protein [Streptomyces sp. MBT33]MBK3646434.1 hypothetical protein [Streptomyces sp. MBT33]
MDFPPAPASDGNTADNPIGSQDEHVTVAGQRDAHHRLLGSHPQAA